MGEAHRVHENLCRGLRELGHEARLAVPHALPAPAPAGSIDLYRVRDGRWGERYLRPWAQARFAARLEPVDAINFVHRISLFSRPEFARYRDLGTLRRASGILGYYALGCDELGLIHANDALPYRPCATCEAQDDMGRQCIAAIRPRAAKARSLLHSHFDAVASAMVEYDHVARGFPGAASRIPLPIDAAAAAWSPARPDRASCVIFHTPTRAGFKGSAIVSDAIERLRRRRTDFEYRVLSNLPPERYWKEVREADIVVDQVWSQSPGTNALLSLAMGKVVFSGNTAAGAAYFPFGAESPVRDAPPDPDALAEALSRALDERHAFARLAEAGRHYVATHHHPVRVAAAFVALWRHAAGAKPAAARQ